MSFYTAIGLEVHVQLRTRSKMFCGCSTEYGAPPNTHVCPVCLGYPGAMPTMNEEAIRLTVLMGLMIGSRINSYSKFDRKSYFYPDMPKNYQISQYDQPLCIGGSVNINVGGVTKPIRVTRIHLEEDVGKNMHFEQTSGVDFNRAGIPLMEIVTEPDMASPDEAFAFLHAIKQIAMYAGVSDCDLEKGNLRVDVNCSVRMDAEGPLGTKTEIKNMNTFKGVHNALEYEVSRQEEILLSGGIVLQETLRWDADQGTTTGMRSKEDAHDYRYFPEPDLMPICLSGETIDDLRRTLPELPAARRSRLVSQYGLPDYDAGVLVADKAVADYFEAVAELSSNPKAVSNWVMTEMLRMLAESDTTIDNVRIGAHELAELISLVDCGTISSTAAKDVFMEMFQQGGRPADIVESKGLRQVSDVDAIELLVARAMTENPASVADYKAGKKAAAKFLVGQVMRLSKGKADPRMVDRMVESKLSGS
ncbi:MAG: Asp-tRNA(Asn)/Glu-tRNA(Gln) amidotransferase subunit GatB [Lentisphaerae bacterium]|nr:Asp-tRNA(Asn)/Glu-tRNA(Gln) amidotransferase subunit GatB [Lentisphaerota bacterium]